MCYHVKFGSSMTKSVRINKRNPQNWGALGPARLGWGVTDQLKQAPPHMKFGSSASNGVRTNWKERPKLWSAGTPLFVARAWLTPRNIPLHIRIILPNLFIIGQTVRSLFRRSAWKCDSFQARSRSSELTRINPPPMTFYSLSIATWAYLRTVFEINGVFSWKSQNIPTFVYLTPHTERISLWIGFRRLVSKN